MSALVFSPKRSLVKEFFKKEEPDWIVLKPRTEADWDACLQTLEGHENQVASVVFSADGQRLASGSYDKTIKIWDAGSGACLQTLEGDERSVKKLSFDDSAGSYLNTDIGCIKLAEKPESSPLNSHREQDKKTRPHGYRLSPNNHWITSNDRNILWLPHNYRPFISAFFPSPLTPTVTFAFGTKLGRVALIRLIGFSDSGPSSAL